MVCTLIEYSSRPISAREIAQSLKKIALDSFWTIREYCANFLVQMAISLLLDTEMNLCSTIKAFKRTFLGLNCGWKNDEIENINIGTLY